MHFRCINEPRSTWYQLVGVSASCIQNCKTSYSSSFSSLHYSIFTTDRQNFPGASSFYPFFCTVVLPVNLLTTMYWCGLRSSATRKPCPKTMSRWSYPQLLPRDFLYRQPWIFYKASFTSCPWSRASCGQGVSTSPGTKTLYPKKSPIPVSAQRPKWAGCYISQHRLSLRIWIIESCSHYWSTYSTFTTSETHVPQRLVRQAHHQIPWITLRGGVI